MIVIGLTGLRGAGKTSARRVAEQLGYQAIDTQEIVQGFLRSKGLQPSHATVRAHASGPHCYNRAVVRNIIGARVRTLWKRGIERVVVDPVYHRATAFSIMASVPCEYYTIGILAPTAVRRARLVGYDGNDLRRRDEWLYELGVGDSLATAEYLVTNTTTLESFERRVAAMLRAIEQRSRLG